MWIGITLVTLAVIAFIVLSKMAGGPKDAVYMVRYAFPHNPQRPLCGEGARIDACANAFLRPRTEGDSAGGIRGLAQPFSARHSERLGVIGA